MPTHARGSMRVLEYAGRGLTANARQPKGIMLMTRGFSPQRSSYDEALVPGGPEVRLRMSTAWAMAYSQKVAGAPAATMLARVSSMTLRMARSATPFSWCTWGGHVVECIPRVCGKAANSEDKNSPALSLCSVPTSFEPLVELRFSAAVNSARNLRTAVGASPLCLRRWTDL
eukprot:5174237-Pleurochrysis_carterae.AAC.6